MPDDAEHRRKSIAANASRLRKFRGRPAGAAHSTGVASRGATFAGRQESRVEFAPRPVRSAGRNQVREGCHRTQFPTTPGQRRAFCLSGCKWPGDDGGTVRYDASMRSAKVGKQRSASGASRSLARALPTLKFPRSASPRPAVGKPAPAGSVKGRRNG